MTDHAHERTIMVKGQRYTQYNKQCEHLRNDKLIMVAQISIRLDYMRNDKLIMVAQISIRLDYSKIKRTESQCRDELEMEIHVFMIQ